MINAGRAKTLDWSKRNDCVCDTMQIYPDGKAKWCGCPKSPVIGNILTGIQMPENFNSECYKNAEDLAEAV